MKLKEKCIYYNHKNGGHYLVTGVNEMIFGLYGEIANPSLLWNIINHDDEHNVIFKIGEIAINSNAWRNYRIDDSNLENFEFVKELSDDEFYPIDIISSSRYRFPSIVIDIEKTGELTRNLVAARRQKEIENDKIQKEIKHLEIAIYRKLAEAMC